MGQTCVLFSVLMHVALPAGLEWVLWGVCGVVCEAASADVLGLHVESPHACGTFYLQMSVVCL